MASQSQSLQDLRDFVRTAIDTDEVDLPNALLDRFIIDGSNRIENYSDSWQFRAVDYTFTTGVGVQTYDIATPGSLYTGITLPVKRVVQIRGPRYILKPQPHTKMRRAYAGTIANTGSPFGYSKWGNLLYMWPKPSVAEVMSLVGYRAPLDWVSTAGAPDFPNDLTELIEWWALGRAHAREGDPGMATFYAGEFAAELRNRAGEYLTGLDAGPFALNQDALDDDDNDWRTAKWGGPRFDWE